MNNFTIHTGIVVPLDMANIDTDAIIPKQFLQQITRHGLGKYLFFNWRYLSNNKDKPNNNFILNNHYYHDASILLTRENFGCGSSREHALWALTDYGFRVILAPSFADIFYINSFNNKLLPVKLLPQEINELFQLTKINKRLFITVNLLTQKVLTNKKIFNFKIDNCYRNSMINDLDNISKTLIYENFIFQYEKKLPNYLK